MNKKLNRSEIETEFYRASDANSLFYSHLDLLLPNSEKKYLEYKKEVPYDIFWHPYDWGHRNGSTFYRHALENAQSLSLRTRVKDEFGIHYDTRNLRYPLNYRKNQLDPSYPKKMNRWREVGDVWLIKSNVTDDGYAIVLITGIKEKSGNRYVEFCLADSNLDYATDLDIYIQGGLHSDMSYDIIAYEDLEGSLFEDDKRFLHRIGRVKQESIENLSIGRTALYKRGNPVFSESNKRFKHRKIKEFEASILSKEVLIWLASGEIDYEKIEFDIEIVKGLSSMKRRHNKITDQQFPFEQIKIPYINHLWKLNSTYKDNLIITSDIELEEEKELVLVNKLDNSEIRLEVGFYNEDL